MQQQDIQAVNQGWKELSTPPSPTKRSKRGRLIVLLSVLLLAALVFAGLRFSMVASGSDDQLQISIGNQQTATLDLRQGSPISTDLFGANVFAKANTSSVDKISSGFLDYTPTLINGLQSMGVKLLRFPGGNWGEQHVLSYDQLGQFAQLLNETNADGMIQANLAGMAGTDDVATGATLAGKWVNFMNDPKSYIRTADGGKLSKEPYHKVALWTVGNEPDQPNAKTGQHLTVADYVNAFIQFSTQMHKNDNTIQVFGPEISQFYGVGAGPFDAGRHAWMDDFLKGVSNYEKANNLPYHLLDGVSFHSYPFQDAQRDPAMLLSSTGSWNYVLPALHDLIKREFGRDMPVALSEISTNPSNGTPPSRGNAALWWADTLGTLMNQQVQYAAYFSAAGIDAPYPLLGGNSQKDTPLARVMQLYTHLQRNVVPLSIQRDPISLYATVDDAHKAVSLLFVNKSPSIQLAQIRTADKFLAVSGWPNLDVTIQGYGVVVVTLHQGLSLGSGGGAEAYSYRAPANDGTAVVPLKYTQCGNRTDALTDDVPC